ncbi:hypothetical protein BU25DRAFT_411642 [Macroventuria anomochaeta]|uniref:Uncharacterized protein n=1 Tax=Macroventuria anomochaeta TaxID=301207 RepID=A0ACB6RY75_9PLEO|nr:uncharacterized protein BU25DRAFT_411642 [Macroventuria anomochaeta]KAF2626668.1 hypothetical protein BU25DRAFT_411642 [Macroventuria anomochaeta]
MMISANLLSFFCLAGIPLLSQAQQNQQAPLKEHQPELVIPLTLSDERTYSLKSALAGARQLSLKAIEKIESYGEINSHPQTVSINIPLNPAQSGTIALGPVASNTLRVQQELKWVETRTPGENVPITLIGIRKGAMVSMDAYTARLALETPYISLPREIYDILIQATNPTPYQHGKGYDDVVDCGALERYPDLVLGLEPETDEEKDDEDIVDREIVITPKQYVLKTEEGQCILLAQRVYQLGREEVVLGWAAVRGRDVVLDWVNKRTGFGR